MTRHFPPPSQDASMMPAMLIEAARCWREARDTRRPVQPGLFALLSRHGHGMLAPVFDSLFALAEGVSGRRIVTGNGPTLSADEHRLIDLFEEAAPPSDGCGLAVALNCGVRSLHILLAQAVGRPVARLAA